MIKTQFAVDPLAPEEGELVLIDNIKTEPNSDPLLVRNEEERKLLSLERNFLDVNEIKTESSNVGYDLASDFEHHPDIYSAMKFEAKEDSWNTGDVKQEMMSDVEEKYDDSEESWNADVKLEMSDVMEKKDDSSETFTQFHCHDNQAIQTSDDIKKAEDFSSITYHTEMVNGITDNDCRTKDTSAPKSLKCNGCDKSFGDWQQLEDHAITHMGANALKCDMCDKRFRRMRTLQDHVLTHTDDKPFKCNDCDKGFRRRQDLQIHVFTHIDEKPFKCDMCTKSFSRAVILRDHALIHTNERPFRCTVCDKSFQRRDTLNVHISTHTDQKPYKCSICDKSFQRRQYLQAHISTHTGNKPFKCNYCNKCFRRRYYLEQHVFTHKAENTVQMYVLL
ncbi:zinc finger protein-like isoform X1 [Periplaneta americana]|uniref:zinc finger protein-like isoform X1 n=2 Tax=Periplaneta americana TaxID=6978 RepID=UPI0037E92539